MENSVSSNRANFFVRLWDEVNYWQCHFKFKKESYSRKERTHRTKVIFADERYQRTERMWLKTIFLTTTRTRFDLELCVNAIQKYLCGKLNTKNLLTQACSQIWCKPNVTDLFFFHIYIKKAQMKLFASECRNFCIPGTCVILCARPDILDCGVACWILFGWTISDKFPWPLEKNLCAKVVKPQAVFLWIQKHFLCFWFAISPVSIETLGVVIVIKLSRG